MHVFALEKGKVWPDGYEGTLLETIEQASSSPGMDPWHAARAVRAAVSLPLDSPNRHDIILAATEFLLTTYRGEQAREIGVALLKQIGNVTIHQRFDLATEVSTRPDLALQAADASEQLSPGPTVFIGICHGGLAGAAMMYLCRQSSHPERGDQFYPVWYSDHHALHTQPQVNDEELAFLRREAHGKRVILVDEDASSGGTLASAVHIFSGWLGQPCLGQVLRASRSPEEIASQGLNWQLCQADNISAG